MAFMMLPVLLLAGLARYNCEPVSGFNYANGNGPSQFGDLLRPPPPPLSIAPVPFHGGKPQQQIKDFRYQYQTTYPPAISTIPPSSEFKFPAPFYKQYNFNFVPQPQPFTTTPSPTFFQKISGWLFPSQQTNSDGSKINLEPFKKDCNPCNLVPWVPVIKYNLGNRNVQESNSPTYGPSTPTSVAQNVVQYRPQSFNFQRSQEQKTNQVNKPHISYGVPEKSHLSGFPSSTYGPPSDTQQISISAQNSLSSIHSSSSSYGVPKTLTPSSSFRQLSSSHDLPNTYSFTTSAYNPKVYGTPSIAFDFSQQVTTHSPVHSNNIPGNINQSPVGHDLDILNIVTPPSHIQLPNVGHPKGFKNSYGEDISNTNALNIPYSFNSLEAASSKINTQVVKSFETNVSIALANPAPFTLNKGRNIHTLQPVALPNLSVSPLPPIFNARPFRPITSSFPTDIIYGINQMKKTSDNVNVAQSVPIAEFVHSIEYPTTIIQSPVIDIDATKSANHNKTYRNIPNSYVIDEPRDITPQASEDHISSAKINQDVSFETTGLETGNNLYESNLPTDMRQNSHIPLNHRQVFADLRGVNDEDQDRYRTESNLQHIDSPLLYLKPSAPHKNFENFVTAPTTSSSINIGLNDYEIYDEIVTRAPIQPTTESKYDTRQNNQKDLSTAPDGRESQPKIVQIIVPYVTEQSKTSHNKEMRSVSQEAQPFVTKEEHLGRKVPSNTEISYFNTATETSTFPTTTTEHISAVTEEINQTPTVLNDFYDVKEPPFDIIKLQHTIDDWTEQEYSNHYSTPDRTRSNEKHAKQIPDDFFTTVNPPQDHKTTEYNFEDYDHEGSSSVQHSVTETRNNTSSKSIKEYNIIERTKNKQLIEKGEDPDENQKPRIYTAASSFRSSTTTPAPWGLIQTSISPLTKEKVYVVTSKPWSDKTQTTTVQETETEQKFESKKINSNNYDEFTLDNFPFTSPRFSNRPSFGFTGSGPMSLDSIKSDSSYGFSKGWHQSSSSEK
ncbi:PREDICTED: uncharacterized protein LOC106123414 isoform X2 [Papilio xuthus]|uniref:Uncharacterized protein LOC106123414 isoform X2 n=1 Tax=Papilio xuthus TaxID=66420 RepID=A0AAJ7EFC7_PAPXU|nr:PREDICTED: uncharacterized protein LOC106123414 isoform X2 [Papilio xuthus]